MKSVEGEVQCGRVAYTQDRNICILSANMPIVYLLPRRGKYTRVYTVVYLRVHNCIHTCTQHRSKYVLCRALPYVHPSGIMPRHFIYAPMASSDMDYTHRAKGQSIPNENKHRHYPLRREGNVRELIFCYLCLIEIRNSRTVLNGKK